MLQSKGHAATAQARVLRIAKHLLAPEPCSSSVGDQPDCDVAILGAGFSGLYAVKLLRDKGFRVRCFERGSGVGGTWFWNRYPGARCDVESMQYSYKFDCELQQEWDWSERYSPQPEILKYVNHVADRHDLRRDIQFDTEVKKLTFQEGPGLWRVETSKGEVVLARFCVCATGCLSQPQRPEQLFQGYSDFKGETYHTCQWPHGGEFGGAKPLSGKRVAVIGTGSSGIQSIPEIAKVVEHLTVFQRTANFTIPAHNRPMDPAYAQQIKADYDEIRKQAYASPGGFGIYDWVPPLFEHPESPAMSFSEEKRNEVYERCWANGGLLFFASFFDLMMNREANDSVADFVRRKIRETVKDPKTAELLCPKGLFGCKRLCVDSHYWETYNRPNVKLVDIAPDSATSTPIQRMTPGGILTSDGTEHKVDAIVFATGYDAMTGAILNIDITGSGGLKIQDAWRDGPRSYLGLSMSGFPNLFTVTGPASPSVFTNMMTSLEQHVLWIATALEDMRSKGLTRIVADRQAELQWMEHNRQVHDLQQEVRGSPQCRSWYTGDNVAGKPRVILPYAGGFDLYTEKLERRTREGYAGFILS